MARIVVVTPHPAVDVTYHVAEQRVGETIRVQRVSRQPGGKGINVVRVLRDLGVAALAVQPVGGPSGDLIRKQLADAGIEAVHIETSHETRSTVAVVDDLSHPTLYAEPGEELGAAAWTHLAEAVSEHCQPGGFLVIAGSFPPHTEPVQVSALVAAGRAAGAVVVVDTWGPALLAAADAKAHVLKPNEAELLQATAAVDLESGMAQLLARGAGAVIVSRGTAGLVHASAGGTRTHQAAVPDVSGNPTGAGDAATAGLVAALLDGLTQTAALRYAAVCGAAAVLARTAGEIDPANLALLDSRLHKTRGTDEYVH